MQSLSKLMNIVMDYNPYSENTLAVSFGYALTVYAEVNEACKMCF